MHMLSKLGLVTMVGLALGITNVGASDRSDYDHRNVDRYRSLFAWLDRDADGKVTRLEADGDVNFIPVFDDMDIDRDGSVTTAELNRFLEQRYGRGLNPRT